LWEQRERLWRFVDIEGIEPANNAAEQALRHAVIGRKVSVVTQSAAGSRFVERMLTVIETCRRQKRNRLCLARRGRPGQPRVPPAWGVSAYAKSDHAAPIRRERRA
jgi:Transposase IS66 family